jgi:carbon monoxide dehydrogenase subunit G
MKVQQSFVIAQPRERVWEFFEDVPAVARCVPGVESVEVVDDDQSNVRMTQSVGPMTATFDLKMRITERERGQRMQFTAIGRAVKGAAGNVRTVNTVALEIVEDGTRVSLESDMAMGGVLGSVGSKVIARQASGITAQFATSLERALGGEPPPAPSPAPATSSPAPPAPVARRAPLAEPRVRVGVAGAAAAVLGLLFALRRRRR